jgi:exodeoxyribonuclease VII small subunit
MVEEKFNFTKAYQEIEEINKWFQREDIDLDEALKKYERGMELIEKCKKRLKEVENKFEEIKKKYSIE